MDRCYIVRTYRVGDTTEKIKFMVSPKCRENKNLRSKEIKKQENRRPALLRHIARIINLNFYRTNGVFVTLDYSETGLKSLGAETEDELYAAAQHQCDLWLRRVRRECKKRGIVFRYFATTSDRDLDGMPVRVHHHVIVSPEAAEICAEKWNLGGVTLRKLYDEPDHNGLVSYMLQQVRVEKHGKRYTPSRNLVHPVPKDRMVYTNAELKVPKGHRLIVMDEHSANSPQYVRYVKVWEAADVPI